MPPSMLRAQSLPSSADNVLVRALVGGDVVGHVFASKWEVKGKGGRVCWVSQLCVRREWRERGFATAVSDVCIVM
jgi:predicted N-acetyltransferase YhbS